VLANFRRAIENSPVHILDYKEFAKIEDEINKRRKPVSDDAEEIWEGCHRALWEVAEAVGRTLLMPNSIFITAATGFTS
jgi:hypothetical protein